MKRRRGQPALFTFEFAKNSSFDIDAWIFEIYFAGVKILPFFFGRKKNK